MRVRSRTPPPQPSPSHVDTGWAWVVVTAVFVDRFFITGVTRSSGLFLLRLVDHYHVTTTQAGMCLTLALVIIAVGAPVATVVGEAVTPRRVVMFGGFLGLVTLVVSGLLPNLPVVAIMVGLAVGVGNSCSYGNGMVMIGKYFRVKRCMATTIAMSGASFGQLVIPLIINNLIDTYGLGGALLISGALYSHSIVAGALLRPVELPCKNEQGTEGVKRVASLSDYDDYLTGDEEDDADDDNDDNDDMEAFERVRNGSVVYYKKKEPNIETIINAENNNGQTDHGDCPVSNVQIVLPQQRFVIPQIIIQNERNESFPLPLTDEWNSLYGGNRVNSKLCSESPRRGSDSSSGTLSPWKNGRQKSGSVENIRRSRLTAGHASLYHQKNKFGSKDKNDGGIDCMKMNNDRKRRFRSFVNLVFDFTVLKNHVTLLFIIVTFLYFVVQYSFIFFLPGITVERGFGGYEKAVVISIVGIGDLAARIGTSFTVPGLSVARFKLKAVAALLGSINVGLFIVASSFAQLAVHSFLHGLLGGVIECLLPGVLTDFVGVSMMAQTLGVVLLFQGMGGAIGQLVLGSLKDMTGSYSIVIIMSSGAMLLSSMLLMLYPTMKGREENRNGNMS